MDKLQNILRRADVERYTGLPRFTIYYKMKNDEFPKPIRISAKSVGWLESEIMQWQKLRIEQRDEESGDE